MFESTLTRTDNNVAPVIIKNCMEEYQHVSDITEPFVYGRLTDKHPQHLLIQVPRTEHYQIDVIDGFEPVPIHFRWIEIEPSLQTYMYM